jgi:hypothetical protein
MRILYHNIVNSLQASSFSAYTEITNYEVSQLQDDILSHYWKTDSTSSQDIIFNLSTVTENVNTVAIIGHNIASTATVTISANDTNSWGSPATSETISNNANMMLYFFSTEQDYNYWKLSITGQGDIEIGKIALGTYMTIEPSSLLDFKVIKKDGSIVTYGKNRQKLAVTGQIWRRIELSLPSTDYTMIKKIEDMYNEVGNYRSIIFCNFDTIRDYQIVEPLYCSIDGVMDFVQNEKMKMNYNLNLEEDK